jgi:hypothetical protein
MKKKTSLLYLLLTWSTLFTMVELCAQTVGEPAAKSKKELKALEELAAFVKTDSLLNSRQFVFQADPGSGYDLVFVVVDSTYAEVQNDNRNNLEGRVTQYEVKKNEKGKTFSVSLKMRGNLYSADVFLFIGAWGDGRATVKSADPLGDFSFDGTALDFEKADYHEGKAIQIR